MSCPLRTSERNCKTTVRTSFWRRVLHRMCALSYHSVTICVAPSFVQEMTLFTHWVTQVSWHFVLNMSLVSRRHAVVQLVVALRYKPESRGFDSRYGR